MSGAQPTDDWGLWVNEVGIFASGIAEGRWLDFLGRAKDDRLVMLWLCPAGGEWFVRCGSREDAKDALEVFADVGFHKAHIKVARLSACQAKTAERKRQADAKVEALEAGRAESEELDEAWEWWLANVMPDREKDRQAAQDAYWAMVCGGEKAEALRQYRQQVAEERIEADMTW